MDYNFISVEQFKALEESGALLESGTYDGMSPNTASSGSPEGYLNDRRYFRENLIREMPFFKVFFFFFSVGLWENFLLIRTFVAY